jgi:L-alanine-DL-glutamate epimerase-like enolase superfamily enzyme
MIIRTCSVQPLQAPLKTPFRIASGQHDSLDNLLFRITLDNKISGYGEAAIATHITGETVPKTLAALKETAAALSGESIADYFSLIAGIKERLHDNHAALAAVEMAVLDAFTRTFRVPLWSLFANKPAYRFQTDITIVIGSIEEAYQAAVSWHRQGFRTFKIKIGKDKSLDTRRILAVHRAAPKAGIIIDANQAFTSTEILKLLADLRRQKVCPILLEQPVARADTDGLRRLTRLARIPVCADESARSLDDVTRLLRSKTVNAINIKLMKSGLLESAQIARVTHASGATLMIGAMMESSLAITAAAHFAAGMGCFSFIDLDTTFFIRGPLSRSPYLDNHGHFNLSGCTPGTGVTVPTAP